MAMKVLILGGNGFLGKNLSQYLLKYNYEIYSFDIIKPQEQDKNICYITGDFFNNEELKNVIKGMDCIIHAISTMNPGNSNDVYMRGYEGDFLQTIHLCQMALDKKIIFLSSGGTVYGNHEKQPIDEYVLPQPINHYGNIKLSIENSMRTFNYQMHTNYIIARISNPYGPGQDFHKGVGFIDAALKNTINNIPIEIWGDGENIRDYIFIKDVCEMLRFLIEYRGKEDTFNISSGKGTSQNAIINVIKELGLNPQVKYEESRSVDVKKIILDNSKIRKLHNFEITKLEKGIRFYYNYLVENHF